MAGLLILVAVAQQLRQYDWMKNFIDTYPGTSASYAPAVTSGFPAWLRWQHLFNIVFMIFLIRAGVQILSDHPRLYLNAGCEPGTAWFRMRDPIPPDRLDQSDAARVWTAKDDSVALPKWLGIPGFRHSIGLARWWHFSFDLLWLINGLVFYVLLFSTGQWRRLVPRSWDLFPQRAIDRGPVRLTALPGQRRLHQLQRPADHRLLHPVFVAAPLAFATGLLQAPAIVARFGFGAGVFNRQARAVHFVILLWMVFFIAVHTVMVFITGLVGNLNHIVLGTNTQSYWAPAVYLVAMTVIAVLWLIASPITIRYPDAVQVVGRWTVGWVKAFMEWAHPKATYTEDDISPYFWPNGRVPTSEHYHQLLSTDWAGWSLRIEGLVENPATLSYNDIRALPKHEQITQHYCIQGWSGVAKWGGVRMADILDIVRPLPSARWVVFYAMADAGADPEEGRYYDCHKIAHVSAPTCLLAYEMNGKPLNETHGAPLRLRNEREIGFNQVKWIEGIEFVDDFTHLGLGQGGAHEDLEFFGYRMPI